MSTPLGFAAALLLGVVASGHCVLMCGGISGALGIVTAKDRRGAARRLLLVGYQAGRITSYALAGALIGGIGGGIVGLLDDDGVRSALRAASAAALLLSALVILGRLRDPGDIVGRRIWLRLAPLGRRLMPVATFPRAFAFGMIWGWMPCGFVYTVLLIAAVSADPVQASATMAAFGLGTLPAMLATGWGAPRLMAWSGRRNVRRAAGVALLACAALVMTGPWLVAQMPGLHGWLPFDCTTSY